MGRAPRPERPAWTADEVDKLMRLWPEMAPGDIADRIGRTETSVRVKASRLGLTLRDPRQLAKERRCLMCLEMFRSESPGRRICRRCRDSDEWQSTADGTYRVGVRIIDDGEGRA